MDVQGVSPSPAQIEAFSLLLANDTKIKLLQSKMAEITALEIDIIRLKGQILRVPGEGISKTSSTGNSTVDAFQSLVFAPEPLELYGTQINEFASNCSALGDRALKNASRSYSGIKRDIARTHKSYEDVLVGLRRAFNKAQSEIGRINSENIRLQKMANG